MEKNFFDNAFDKAKNAFEIAYKKTGEIVSIEKLKFNLASLKSKRSKLFTTLGISYYKRIKDNADLTENEKAIVQEIADLNAKIDDIINEINYAKSKRICPNCGEAIDEKSIYCNICGQKLTFDSENEEDYDEI